MILSTNTSALVKRFGHKEVIRLLAEAGFDAYDMSFYGNTNPDTNPMYGYKYIEYCK